RQTTRARLSPEIIERSVRQHFEVDGQRRTFEVDAPAARLLDPAPDFPLDLRGGEGKSFVGAPGADAEGFGMLALEIAKNDRRQLVQVEGTPSCTREVRDPENMPQTIAGARPRALVLELDLHTTHHGPDRSDRKTRQCRLDVADQQLDEPGPVFALQRKLLVVDDDGCHGCSAASAARWPLRTALSIVAGRPVSIQSPARTSPLTPVRTSGRGGCPGASENVARGSRTTDACRSRAERAAGTASTSSFMATSTSSGFDRPNRAVAPLDTRET